MDYLEEIKANIEKFSCPEHEVNPVIEIDGTHIQLRACCQSFGERIQRLIEENVKYYKLQSLRQSQMDDIQNTSTDPVSKIIFEGSNLIYEQQYDAGIATLTNLLQSIRKDQHSYLRMIHINLMIAFFKIRDERYDALEKCNFHAKMAIVHGHNTGFAAKRLAINFEKLGRIHNAIEVCNLVLNPMYRLSAYGMSKDEFKKRLDKLHKKGGNTPEYVTTSFFSKEEINLSIQNSNS